MVEIGPPRRGDWPISPGSASGRSGGHGGGGCGAGAGKGKRGGTSGRWRRRTRALTPATSAPAVVSGRGRSPTKRTPTDLAGKDLREVQRPQRRRRRQRQSRVGFAVLPPRNARPADTAEARFGETGSRCGPPATGNVCGGRGATCERRHAAAVKSPWCRLVAGEVSNLPDQY